MKIMNLFFLWQLFKWVAIIVLGYALIRAGISPAIICLIFMIRLALRLFFHCIHFIGGIILIAIKFIILILLFTTIL
jgi:hypothetical protein